MVSKEVESLPYHHGYTPNHHHQCYKQHVQENLYLTARCGAHTFNPSTQKAEAGRYLWIWGQTGLHSEFLFHFFNQFSSKQKSPKLHKSSSCNEIALKMLQFSWKTHTKGVYVWGGVQLLKSSCCSRRRPVPVPTLGSSRWSGALFWPSQASTPHSHTQTQK